MSLPDFIAAALLIFATTLLSCTESASQPTACSRQLELCRVDNANLTAALADCKK